MTPDYSSLLVRGLIDLGVRPGGILLVHSSLRSLGPVPNKAAVVIDVLCQAVGVTRDAPQLGGTLLLPALSYETVGAHNPLFDVRNTPTCVGALPEYFRTQVPGVVRSVHPTHSVCALGARADELTRDHVRSTTPCGDFSPFARLPHENGQILFLGCGLEPNTSMHAVEEHVEPPYLYGEAVDYRVILADGSETSMRVRSHDFRGTVQRYDRLERVMHSGIKQGKVLEAECFLLEASEMWMAALSAYRADPLYFVDQE